MYRPTVRYSDIYRTYIDDIFKATSLDRNQIFRLALFTAAYNPRFIELLEQHQKKDVPLPSPQWTHSMHHIWLEQDIDIKEGESNNDYIERERETSSSSKISGTPGPSRSIPGTTIQPKQQYTSSTQKKQPNRRQQPPKGYTGEVPSIQFSNSGGIKLDFR
ncbi:hypothetical protein J7E51_27845 [Priestia megaterium]|nr:hypothetical protein [Priestia megaterium]